LENAIGMMILGMIIVALLVLFLYAQASLISTSLEMRERIRLERARAEENIRISWLSDQEILLTNDGARDTVVRYLYIYPEGSEVPTRYVRLNLTLRVGESKRINLAVPEIADGISVARVDVITELGSFFSSLKPNRLMKGVKVGG